MLGEGELLALDSPGLRLLISCDNLSLAEDLSPLPATPYPCPGGPSGAGGWIPLPLPLALPLPRGMCGLSSAMMLDKMQI